MSSKKGGGLSASSAGLKRTQWSDLCAESPLLRSDTSGKKLSEDHRDGRAGRYK